MSQAKSESASKKRVRFLIVATYVWLVIAYVGLIGFFGINSEMRPGEFRNFAMENWREMVIWGTFVLVSGVSGSFAIRELRLLIRRYRASNF
jgi:hypothetical protein